jgi:hypothetical protein
MSQRDVARSRPTSPGVWAWPPSTTGAVGVPVHGIVLTSAGDVLTKMHVMDGTIQMQGPLLPGELGDLGGHAGRGECLTGTI